MSLLPEFVLQQILVKGFKAFKDNENLVRMLFRHAEMRDVEDVAKFLRNNVIDICINYPDKDLVVPSIIILMGSETESDPVLGELQQGAEGFREEAPFPKETLLGDQTVLGGGSISSVGGPSTQGRLLLPPTTAVSAASTTIYAPVGTIVLIDPYEENEIYVETIEGTGAGQRRLVSSITPPLSGTPVEIDISSAWDTIPDNTTVFKLIGGRIQQPTGEPPKLFAPGDNVERLGQIYEARYRLDIVAKPVELTIYLYSIIKAIFTINKQLILNQGLLSFSMGGTDIGPVPEYYPQLAYRRSMNITFKYAFDVITELSHEVATQLQVSLSVHDPDVGDAAGVEREVSTTSFNI